MSSSQRPPDAASGRQQHRREGPRALGVALITVSDSRSGASDHSGALAERLLLAAGHHLVARHLVPDDPERIEGAVLGALATVDCSAVILTGGTGVSPRDRTPEVLAGLWERELPGFGEFFRRLSWEEIGSAAMLSRACAGLREGRLLVALPGAPAAVRLGLERLLLPELGHLVGQLRRVEGAQREGRPLDEEPA
ncbi:MogA/MoaB family molybdenum cofactor biosynthesis protein [bacterium]|nr:MogA/MoaB family molybdenum cofactor biosynthesis protein [bacterium]